MEFIRSWSLVPFCVERVPLPNDASIILISRLLQDFISILTLLDLCICIGLCLGLLSSIGNWCSDFLCVVLVEELVEVKH